MTNLTTSPWGEVQGIDHYGEGIKFVRTASHGGFFLSDHCVSLMPTKYRETRRFNGHINWFEEDCDWALVALSFPHLFTSTDIDNAISIFDHYHSKKGEVNHV